MILTDNILLEIFDFYRLTHSYTLWEWHVLIHVCRRWRQIVFGSPSRLYLRIRCTSKTHVENLGIWPAFPIAIDFDSIPGDAIAVSENTDRVRYFKLDLAAGSHLETLARIASKPFPILTHLIIHVDGVHAPLLPDKFLGGSAPRLQTIYMHNITFPALQTLLLSAGDLVELQLRSTPIHHYTLPVRMAICLAELPRLKTFVLQFPSSFFSPDQIHQPPITRAVLLPALTNFEFRGTSKYLEDFVARIDCPQLNRILIRLLGDEYQFVQLTRFFNRSIPPFRHAKACVYDDGITFDLYHSANRTGWDSHPATTVVSCTPIDWYIFDILNQFSAILSTVVDLKFVVNWQRDYISDRYNLEWLPFLHQLPALQALYVSLPFAEGVGHALKSLKGEEVAEALPSLELISLEDQAPSIQEFVAVRQLSDRPLTVVGTEAEFDQRLGEKKRIPHTD